MCARDPSESVRALLKAIGVQPWCREATIRMAVGEVVTVNTLSYATDEQLNALTGEIVSRRMVLVDADEYARLKAAAAAVDWETPGPDHFADASKMVESMKQGTASVNEARAAFGLPPVDPQEASA